MDLDRSVVIVTGSGAGLGATLAHAFAVRGAHVVVADRDHSTAASVADDIRSGGGLATSCTCDVLVEDDLIGLVALADSLGGAEVVVNNAGGWGGGEGQYPDAPVEEWSAVLDLNLRAPMLLTQLCLPGMRGRGVGSVVNIASSAGIEGGGYGSPPYAAAKAGLVRLTTSLAGLGAAGVRVTCVVPGWVGLPRAHAEWAALAPAARARTPALVPPALVADEVVALVRGDAPGGTVVSLLEGRHREVTTPPG